MDDALPVLTPCHALRIGRMPVVLKSGNFGSRDFYILLMAGYPSRSCPHEIVGVGLARP